MPESVAARIASTAASAKLSQPVIAGAGLPRTNSFSIYFRKREFRRTCVHDAKLRGPTITSSVGAALLTIRTFTMGCSPEDSDCAADEKPAHQVTITKGFWIGQTDVTQAAYFALTARTAPLRPRIVQH